MLSITHIVVFFLLQIFILNQLLSLIYHAFIFKNEKSLKRRAVDELELYILFYSPPLFLIIDVMERNK